MTQPATLDATVTDEIQAITAATATACDTACPWDAALVCARATPHTVGWLDVHVAKNAATGELTQWQA